MFGTSEFSRQRLGNFADKFGMKPLYIIGEVLGLLVTEWSFNDPKAPYRKRELLMVRNPDTTLKLPTLRPLHRKGDA